VLVDPLHLLVRLDPEAAEGWSDKEVMRRWGRLSPPCDMSRQQVLEPDGRAQGRL